MSVVWIRKRCRQLDELSDLLRRQQRELRQQTEEANSMLDDCRGELERADQSVRIIERLREIQAIDMRRRQDRRTRPDS